MSEKVNMRPEDHLFEFCIRFSLVFCLLPLQDVSEKLKKKEAITTFDKFLLRSKTVHSSPDSVIILRVRCRVAQLSRYRS